MRTTRIYVNTPLQLGLITLDAAAGQHLITVLRLKVGATVQLFNHQHQEYLGQISQADKKKCVVQLTQSLPILPASPLYTHLGLSLTKGDRMDFAIQKSVELGVSEITPLLTQFTDVTLDAERSIKKQTHWQKIALHACEQCGRSDIPTIHPLTPFAQWIQQPTAHTKLILHPLAEKSNAADKTHSTVADLLKNSTRINIGIGPEGGFHTNEITLAVAHDFHALSLGPRILRSETAPVVVLSILQWLKGDLIR